MDKLCREIREYADSPQIIKVVQLLKERLQKARESNDSSPVEEVLKNQGAIKELRWLISHITNTTRDNR